MVLPIPYISRQDEKSFSTCLSPFLNRIACLKQALNKSEEISQFQIDFYPDYLIFLSFFLLTGPTPCDSNYASTKTSSFGYQTQACRKESSGNVLISRKKSYFIILLCIWNILILRVFLLFILQAAAEYAKILATRQKEAKEAKELRRKRSASLRESRNSVKST